MDKQIDILTIGDVAVDLHMRVGETNVVQDGLDTEHPKVCFYHGSKVPVEEFKTTIAGNSVNVAVAASKLGLHTAIYTETGDDGNADKLMDELKEFNVDTSFVKRNAGTQTDVHTIILYAGDRTIFSYHGQRDYKIQNWPKPKFIYYTSIGKGFEGFQGELIKYLQANPDVGVACNPGTFQLKAGVDNLKPIFALTDILLVNKEEAALLTNSEGTLEELHKKLNALGPKISVITDGINGSSTYDGKELVFQKAYIDSRPLLDKTGAGDAFSASFVAAIIYGKTLQQALKWGVINSGSIVKVIGGIHGLLSKEDIEKVAVEFN